MELNDIKEALNKLKKIISEDYSSDHEKQLSILKEITTSEEYKCRFL